MYTLFQRVDYCDMLFVEFQRYFIDNISDQYTNIHSFHINHAGGFVHAGEYGDVA